MPDRKICTRCGKEKSLEDFYLYKKGEKAGKYSSRCRACSVAVVIESRLRQPDYEQKQRDYQRNFRDRHKERLSVINSERYAQDKERRKMAARKARQKNPLREKAHYAVRQAVNKNIFPPAKTMVCEYCQEAQASSWHHYLGYEEKFWLHVKATCKPCHGKEHWKTNG